jgi:hypothetical protein
MRFPLSEAEITDLSKSIANGIAVNPDKFPQPPVAPEVLEEALSAFQTTNRESINARAAALAATTAKQEALDRLVALMKSDLRYAEMITNRDDATLKALGWSAPREKKSQVAPGQPLNLTASLDDQGTLTLRWDAPVDGGRVLAYSVRRRLKTETAWQEIATAMETTIRLKNQPEGRSLEYIVVAMNKSGAGMESNTVAVKM